MAAATDAAFQKVQITRDDTVSLQTLTTSRFHCDYNFLKLIGSYFESSLTYSRFEFQTFDAYVLGKEGAPGIVVLQEWWSVDFEVKNHAQKIAQIGDGYPALIPDLYRGKVGLDVAEAQHLDGLDWAGAVKDIQASVNNNPQMAFFGIFASHGSTKAAEFASKNMGKHIVEEVMRGDDKCILEGAVAKGNLKTDSKLLKKKVASGTCSVPRY